MANRVRIRARGLAALLTSYKIKQSTGKQGSIKKAKERTLSGEILRRKLSALTFIKRCI